MTDRPDRRPWLVGAALVIVVGTVARLVFPDLRPIHNDEAVNWYLSGRVINNGVYHYDPSNYHGPLFFYLTAAGRPLAWIFGRLTALRVPTMLAGAAMIPLVLATARQQGRRSALLAAAFLALSPAAVFYARDAIHETWLALFTLGALVAAWRACTSERPVRDWAIAGACVGGMVAMKETAVLTFVGWAAALGAMVAMGGWSALPRPSGKAIGAAGGAAGAVVVASYSGFGQAPGDLLGLFETLTLWGQRGMEGDGHEKAWWTFGWWLLRAEGPAVVLSVAALVAAAWTRDRGDVGLAVWLVVTTALYSAISYKTPWCALQLTLPAALLAGRWVGRLPLPAAWAVGGLGLVGAAALTVSSSFVRYDVIEEPLVYVQTHRETAYAVGVVGDVLDAVGSDATLRYFYSARYPFNWYLDRGGLEPEDEDGMPSHVDGDAIIASPHRLPDLQETMTQDYLWQRFDFREGMQVDVWIALEHEALIDDNGGWARVSPIGPDTL